MAHNHFGGSLESGKLFPNATGEILKNVSTIFYMEMNKDSIDFINLQAA